MRENGVPSGLTTENMVLATNELAKAAIDVGEEARKANIIGDTALSNMTDRVDAAAESFEKSRNLEVLLKDAIFMVADGKVTGLGPQAADLFGRAARIVGVEDYTREAFKDLQTNHIQEYNSLMKDISNQLIQEILQEGSKNLSNVDRQLAQEIVGLYHGWWALGSTDPNVIAGKLQRTYEKLKLNQNQISHVFINLIISTRLRRNVSKLKSLGKAYIYIYIYIYIY